MPGSNNLAYLVFELTCFFPLSHYENLNNDVFALVYLVLLNPNNIFHRNRLTPSLYNDLDFDTSYLVTATNFEKLWYHMFTLIGSDRAPTMEMAPGRWV